MKFSLPLPGQPLASVPNQDIYETKESHLRRKFHHLEGFRHPKELHWQLCGGISRCVRGSWRMPSATLEVSLFWCRSQGLQFMISATNFYIVILSAMMIQKCGVLSNRAKTYFLFTGVVVVVGGGTIFNFPSSSQISAYFSAIRKFYKRQLKKPHHFSAYS